MSPRDTLRSAVEAILGWRLRSALTMLGILVGVAAVIVTVGIGEGSQRAVAAQISALGTNLLVVTPGSQASGGVQGGFGSQVTLTLTDSEALGQKFNAPDVAAVAPVAQQEALLLVAGSRNWTAPVLGTSPGYATVRNVRLAQGAFFTASDVRNQTQVVVLGPLTAQSLFGGGNAVGNNVNIGSVPFRVVGVLAPQGSAAGTAQDDLALVPVTTAQDRLFGGPFRRSLSLILLTATSKDTMGAVEQEATSLLAALHGVSAEQPDFTITAQDQLLTTANAVNRTLTILLASIAAISLLVGGIGVMNIMLVSVTERIAEIGLRKAVGARSTDVLLQFLAEAGFLGALGGAAGVAVGIAAAEIVSRLSSTEVTLSGPAIAVAVAVAVAVGLCFGVYPAARAARLAPITALRSA